MDNRSGQTHMWVPEMVVFSPLHFSHWAQKPFCQAFLHTLLRSGQSVHKQSISPAALVLLQPVINPSSSLKTKYVLPTANLSIYLSTSDRTKPIHSTVGHIHINIKSTSLNMEKWGSCVARASMIKSASCKGPHFPQTSGKSQAPNLQKMLQLLAISSCFRCTSKNPTQGTIMLLQNVINIWVWKSSKSGGKGFLTHTSKCKTWSLAVRRRKCSLQEGKKQINRMGAKE